MEIHPSVWALAAARRMPTLAKLDLWLLGKYYGYCKASPHWVFVKMASAVNYRPPFLVALKDGTKLRVAVNDDAYQGIVRFGCTEPYSVALMSKLVKPGDVFFDLGAHIGQFTLLASKWVGPLGVVHSFEPDPETFRWLRGNMKRNRVANVYLNNAAVSEKSGCAELHLATTDNTGANSLASPPSPSGHIVRVSVTSLDDYCSGHGIGRVDFIKIDVEGAEVDVLKGAERLLSHARKPPIHIEFNAKMQRVFGRSLGELSQILLSYGYQLFRLTNDEQLKDLWFDAEEPRIFNVLCFPKEDGQRLTADCGLAS